jgi:hypothetical protein
VFHASAAWLKASFPAVFGDTQDKPFGAPSEALTPRIRQLAEALTVEVLNDRFLSTERLEFMLQELVLSIIDIYLSRQHPAASWRGSRYEDSRIRRAIGLLRARPTKELNIDDLASQVWAMDNGTLAAYDGNYSDYVIEKARREAVGAAVPTVSTNGKRPAQVAPAVKVDTREQNKAAQRQERAAERERSNDQA